MSSCKEQDITEHSDHTEAIGLIIYYKEQPFFKVLNGKIDSTISTSLVFERGVNYSPLEVRFIDSDGEIIIPDEEGKNFSWEIVDSSLLDIKFYNGEKWKFSILGRKVGSTQIEFFLNHYDHPDFRTPKLPVEVIE